MPVATVNEDHRAVPLQHQIGRSQERPIVKSESEPGSVEKASNPPLRTRVLAPHRLHDASPQRVDGWVGIGSVVDCHTSTAGGS